MPAIGPEQAGVADQPAGDVGAVVAQQFPGHHQDADDAGDQAAGAEGDAARVEVREVVGGRDDVGGDVGVQGRDEDGDQRDEGDDGLVEAADQRDRVPDGLAEEDDRGGGDGDADEGVERHGGGQAERLAERLCALAVGVAGEVGNIQRDGGPEADHAGERGDEEAEEFAGGVEFARAS